MKFIDRENYPNTKVTILFSFFGISFSVFLISFIFFIFAGFKEGWLDILYLTIQGAVVFGFVPAFMTGLTSALLQFKTDTEWVFFKCSLVGFITTFVYVSLLALKINIMCFFMSLFGAILAPVIALVALPSNENT